jgi:hypothetical protein
MSDRALPLWAWVTLMLLASCLLVLLGRQFA